MLSAAAPFAIAADSLSAGACSACHKNQTADFSGTKMARALESGSDSVILKANPFLHIQIGGYEYRIERTGEGSVYSVSDGKQTIRIPIDWAFGQGSAGQTWVFQREGRWYESRVSYYSALGGLDVTMGAKDIPVHNLGEAAGRLLNASDTTECFACHATGNIRSITPGLRCERCHGPSEQHLKGAPMRRLSQMSTEEMSDFCGTCHRSWSEISIKGPKGPLNVRFQPYRLTLSKCYDAEDKRIRCTACHDPHRAMETSTKAYDSRCLSCHATGKACPVAKENCVTCHMPLTELTGAHKKFSDHRIRIVRAGEAYPD